MKITILLSVAGLLATGVVTKEPRTAVPACAAACSEADVSLAGRKASERSGDAEVPVGKMKLSTEVLYRGDVLEVKFSTPHGANLAIKDPNGKFFYVVFPATDAAPKLVPLVDSKKFVRLNYLRILTDQLKADPYTYGVHENQPVFTKSGTYTLIMGHNLHIDDESELAIVKVKYHHKARPATAPQDIAAN
jgi:hypothetical protein